MKTAILAHVCLFILMTKSSASQSPFRNSDKECRTMLPSRARSPPREDKSLYEVRVSDTIYHEDMHHIEVSIVNKTSRPIGWVLLQPRLKGCDGPDVDHNIGEFEMLPGNDYFEFLNCRQNPKGAVVTKQWSGKPYEGKIEVNFVITTTKRKIKFRATIISPDGNIYLHNDSEEIRYISLKGTDLSKAEECPKIKHFALQVESNNEANSCHTSNYFIFIVFLFGLSYFY
eukprot:XP_011432070.1 PREDICTED: uncharacterized protein LOC105331533 [Crassostrea gigas]